MTAQLPPSSYSFPAAFPNSSSFQHDASASAITNFDHHSTHDSTSHPLNHSDTTPFSSTATPSSSYFSHSFTSPPLSGSEDIPKLGSIRCYWTILSPSLDYVYLDPLLEHHLGDQARQFLGSNLLDFVHPDERDQLAEDLLPKPDRIAGVETAGVFGSVTRLRYSRLVGILRKLGCPDVPTLPDADKYALDEDYLNLDLTTSWIAGNGITRGTGSDGGSGGGGNLGNGAVLAFFHVVGDKDHVKNNDQFERGDWTNWCGVQVDEHRYFTPTRCQALVDVLERITSSTSRPSTALSAEEDSKSALLASLHGLSSDSTDGPPPHVFQILDRNGKTIVSFPTPQDDDGRKRYEVESYAALAREVVARPRGAANAKTSCTKRYRSKHPVMKDSILTTIESVVIMYGSITFACFQTGGIYLTSAKKTALGLNQASMNPAPVANDFNLEDVPSTAPNPKSYLGYNNNTNSKRASPFIQGPPSLGSPPIKRIKKEANASPRHISNSATDDSNDSKNLSISTAFGRGPYRPSLEPEYGQNGGVSPTVASASAILGSISTSNQNEGTSSTTATQDHHQQFTPSNFPHIRPHGASPASLYPPAYPLYSQSQSTSPYQAPQSQGNGYFPQNFNQPSTTNDSSHQQTQNQTQNSFSSSIHRDPLPVRSMNSNQPQDSGPSGGVSNGNNEADPSEAKEPKKGRTKPDGPVSKPGPGKACESCGTVESPEWRKGPSGAKSLCNACGLRHARTVARQKKLAEQEANGVPPKVKKKRGKKAAKEAAEQAAATASTSASNPSSGAPLINTLPATSSAHTTYEPAFSRSDSIPNYKAYTPYYTSAPPHSSSYAVVAAHPPSSSGPPQTSSSVSAYPISSSGYYPATTTYPFSTYPPTSAPILTHIPIHHTLAATLAPLSAPVSIQSHDYPRNGPVPTSYPHSSYSFASSSDAVHAYSQASDNAGLYHQHLQQQHHQTSSSSAPTWQPTFTSSEIPHSTSSAPSSQPSLVPSSYSSAPPHHSMNSHSNSPHLHHPQPTSYQPYQGWNQDHSSQQQQHDGNGGGRNNAHGHYDSQ